MKTQTTSETLNEVSWYYAELQRAYRNWAKQFGGRGEVVQWLKEHGVKGAKKIRNQANFNLLSSDWNRITIPVLYRVAPHSIEEMRQKFVNLFQNQYQADIEKIWYLLFLVHPGRHELWYFEEFKGDTKKGHFQQGYHSRLARFSRSHRLGLKGAKKYLNGKGRVAVRASLLKAYGTVAFRNVHLHPTTIEWQASGTRDLCETIRRLEIGRDALSLQEQNVAIALSRRADFNFDNWINYAQCAINEGPIFSLKAGKQLFDCFGDIVQVLSSERITQNVLRDILEKHHIVEE